MQVAERAIFDDLNAHREAVAVEALQLDERLAVLAYERANDMLRRHYFAHQNPEGLSALDLLRSRAYSFAYAGENIAFASNEREAERVLWSSQPHRENMLGPHYHRVGIAVVFTTNAESYVVQIFSD